MNNSLFEQQFLAKALVTISTTEQELQKLDKYLLIHFEITDKDDFHCVWGNIL